MLESLKTETRKEAKNLANTIASIAPRPAKAGASVQPRRTLDILMYFDEARVLMQTPPTNAVPGKTLYDVFLSVLNSYTDIPLFVLFLSTTFHIAQPAPTRAQAVSSRYVALIEAFQAPITEAPFDSDPDIVVEHNVHKRRDVAGPRFMARFGRPL